MLSWALILQAELPLFEHSTDVLLLSLWLPQCLDALSSIKTIKGRQVEIELLHITGKCCCLVASGAASF
jgi:hypothetical protein